MQESSTIVDGYFMVNMLKYMFWTFLTAVKFWSHILFFPFVKLASLIV